MSDPCMRWVWAQDVDAPESLDGGALRTAYRKYETVTPLLDLLELRFRRPFQSAYHLHVPCHLS